VGTYAHMAVFLTVHTHPHTERLFSGTCQYLNSCLFYSNWGQGNSAEGFEDTISYRMFFQNFCLWQKLYAPSPPRFSETQKAVSAFPVNHPFPGCRDCCCLHRGRAGYTRSCKADGFTISKPERAYGSEAHLVRRF
jgi:hypothetical protein